MHQPIKWWTGLLPLALVWFLGNFLKTEIVEADLTNRSKAAIAAVSANLTDKPSMTVAGRDVTLSGKSSPPQILAADKTFGVRKVIAGAPLPVLGAADCQAELSAKVKNERIRFELASAKLADVALPLLNAIVSIAQRCKSGSIEVAGHTDSTGDAPGNLTLSKARAQSVVDYLVKRAVDPARISAIGYGDTRPVAPNTTEAGMAQNRRIEFTVK